MQKPQGLPGLLEKVQGLEEQARALSEASARANGGGAEKAKALSEVLARANGGRVAPPRPRAPPRAPPQGVVVEFPNGARHASEPERAALRRRGGAEQGHLAAQAERRGPGDVHDPPSGALTGLQKKIAVFVTLFILLILVIIFVVHATSGAA